MTFGENLPLSPTELCLNSQLMCVYYLESHTHTPPTPPPPEDGGCHQCQRVFPGVKLAAARGQESGLISACHQRRLSLHTHSGRAVHRGSEKKAVNLAPAHTPDVTLMCPEFPPSTLSALLVRSGEKRRKGRDNKKKKRLKILNDF